MWQGCQAIPKISSKVRGNSKGTWGVTGIALQWQWLFIHGLFHNTTEWTPLPLILTVGEFGPADCFLHPLQFWHRLSASEMKEQRESSSKRSESSKENLSPSSHSANISSITLAGGEGKKKRKGWSLGVSCSSGRTVQLAQLTHRVQAECMGEEEHFHWGNL